MPVGRCYKYTDLKKINPLIPLALDNELKYSKAKNCAILSLWKNGI